MIEIPSEKEVEEELMAMVDDGLMTMSVDPEDGNPVFKLTEKGEFVAQAVMMGEEVGPTRPEILAWLEKNWEERDE